MNALPARWIQSERSLRGTARALLCSVAPAMTLGTTPMFDDDDPELIRRVAAKDRGAFEILYQRYAQRVHRYLSRLIGSPEITEEVLDDVMLVVWQSASRFNHTSRLSTWILGIAHHKALKARARLSGRPPELPVSEQQTADGEGPEEATLRGELDRLLARGLEALSPEQRAVVELTFYQGHSYQEIAEITRCPVNTVKTRMFHARRRLAPILTALGLGRRPASQEAPG
jgi:RNA polymerase sigma factor (sigma-70 family)